MVTMINQGSSLGADIAKEEALKAEKANKMALAAKGLKLATAGSEPGSGGDMASQIAAGAGAGSAFGAPGIAIGAGIGAVSGIAGAAANRKAKRAKAQADMHESMIEIEGKKADRIQGALKDMRQAFSSALRIPTNIALGGR